MATWLHEVNDDKPKWNVERTSLYEAKHDLLQGRVPIVRLLGL